MLKSFWGMICGRMATSLALSLEVNFEMSFPSIRILPLYLFAELRQPTSVDFPLPFFPIMAVILPFSAENDMLSIRTLPLFLTVTFLNSSIVSSPFHQKNKEEGSADKGHDNTHRNL